MQLADAGGECAFNMLKRFDISRPGSRWCLRSTTPEQAEDTLDIHDCGKTTMRQMRSLDSNLVPCILSTALLVLGAVQNMISAEERAVSVTIGGSSRLAACSERAVIDGGRVVALMSGPDHEARRITSLASGSQLFVCEHRGDWLGVVVAAVDPETCGVSLSQAQREPYRGGCVSGWLLRSDVVLMRK